MNAMQYKYETKEEFVLRMCEENDYWTGCDDAFCSCHAYRAIFYKADYCNWDNCAECDEAKELLHAYHGCDYCDNCVPNDWYD